jgi:hypothetical protein
MKIIGVHQYKPSKELFQEAIEHQWGTNLSGKEIEDAIENVKEHFDGLYLIEIVSASPLNSDFDWSAITQEVPDVPRNNLQVPYDEQQLDDEGYRWAFFFHYLDFNLPLSTPAGKFKLPDASPLPEHLANMKYELP